MTSKIKIPLRDLNEEIIKELKEKYPEAEISLEVPQNKQKAPLSEQRFWDIIALLDWSKEGDDDNIVKPATKALASNSIRQIFDFADILSEKLFSLDQMIYAQHIGEDAWVPDQYFSVDNFLYARCCVVANGNELYNKVIKDPIQMPKDLTFEALLYLPSEAYEQKTGKKYDYSPSFPVETYSNKDGWKEY